MDATQKRKKTAPRARICCIGSATPSGVDKKDVDETRKQEGLYRRSNREEEARKRYA